jgi:tellurite resistance-related uncharacterized protein
MRSLPKTVEAYQRTKEFSAATVPAGLTREHDTKAGVWGRICVLEGTLHYRILAPEPEEHLLSPGHDGIIEPQILHEVEATEGVRFYVEFLRDSD